MAEKVCAVMVALYATEDDMQQFRQVAERFEKLNEIPVRIIVDRDLAGDYLSFPHFGRYHAWRFVAPDVEKIIYFDNDILPLKPLPELPDVDFAAVPDCEEAYTLTKTHWPTIKQARTYFNSGFFIASTKTQPVFKAILDRQTHINGKSKPWYADQTMANLEVQLAAKNGDITVEMLPKKWNYMPVVDAERVVDPCMLHLTGVPFAGKVRLLSQLLTALP